MVQENAQTPSTEPPPPLPAEPCVVYESVMEALYHRALRPLMSEDCLRDLAQAGLDLAAPLRPQYPVEDTVRYLQIARSHVYPDHDDEEAYRRMGRLFIQGYFQTALGGAVRMLLRLLGPERNLLRMPAYFEGGTSYMKVSVKKLAPGDFELAVSGGSAHPPSFTQGALLQAMRFAGADQLLADYFALPDGRIIHRIRWATR
jgi:uncharacterized protein (TIGR02265 family)